MSDELTTRVMQYGCLAPIVGADIVAEQMRAGAAYYNDLIALERERRNAYRNLRRQVVDIEAVEQRVTALASELQEVRKTINAERQKAGRRVRTPELDAQAKDLADKLRAARKIREGHPASETPGPRVQNQHARRRG